jgi:hypothetical protein
VGQTVEDRADKRKWPIDWLLFVVTDCWIIPHSEATTGENGSRRIDDITILNITMNAEHLSKAHQYKISDLDRAGPVNIFGRSINIDDPEFRLNFDLIGDFPCKLLKEAVRKVADIMDENSEKPLRYNRTSDFLGPIRHWQWQAMRVVKMIFKRASDRQQEYREMLSEVYTSRDKVNQLLAKVETILFAMEIIEKKGHGDLDQVVIKTILSSCMKNLRSLNDTEKENIRELNNSITELLESGNGITITNFLVLLSDCFETQINSGETHTALLASTSAGGQKRKTQPPLKNVTTQEKTAPSTTADSGPSRRVWNTYRSE